MEHTFIRLQGPNLSSSTLEGKISGVVIDNPNAHAITQVNKKGRYDTATALPIGPRKEQDMYGLEVDGVTVYVEQTITMDEAQAKFNNGIARIGWISTIDSDTKEVVKTIEPLHTFFYVCKTNNLVHTKKELGQQLNSIINEGIHTERRKSLTKPIVATYQDREVVAISLPVKLEEKEHIIDVLRDRERIDFEKHSYSLLDENEQWHPIQMNTRGEYIKKEEPLYVLHPKEQGYVKEYAQKLNIPITMRYWNKNTTTCKEKLELLLEIEPESKLNHIVATYLFQDNEEYVAIVGPNLADIDTLSIAKQQNQRVNPTSKLVQGMQKGTCTPFFHESVANAMRVIILDIPHQNDVVDISVGGVGNPGHRASMAIHYSGIAQILESKFPDRVQHQPHPLYK